MIETYSRVRSSGRGYGWPYQPSATCGPEAPSPTIMRPPLRWSIVWAAIAVAVGVRAEIWQTAVPSFIVLVRAPHHASGAIASDPYASAVHRLLTPASSASAMRRSTSFGGPALQY